MNIINRIMHQEADGGFQMALTAIGAQHEKPGVNRWIPPKLFDVEPLKPCMLYFKIRDGEYRAACWQSLWLNRMMNYRANIFGSLAIFTRDELMLLKEGGYKITVEQERIEI